MIYRINTSPMGFNTRFRVTSLNFCTSVGGGCVHGMLSFSQLGHAFDASLYRVSSWNSTSTAFGDTHPRSHCNDFRASAARFLDSSHRGVSGIFR